LERGRVEEAGEAAEPADGLGAGGLLDPLLHEVDGAVAGFDVDARARVAGTRVWRGHGLRTFVSGGYELYGRRSASAPPTPAVSVWTPSTSDFVGAAVSDSRRCLPSSSGSGSSIGY